MKTGTLLFVSGIVGVAAYAILTGYDYYKRVAFRMAGLRIDELDIDGSTALRLTLGMQIYNPTPVTLTCRGMQGYVYINGYPVGVVDVRQPQKVYAKGVSLVYTEVLADVSRLGGAALGNLIQGNDLQDWLIGINGSININGLNIPVNFQEDIKSIME